MFHTPPPLSRKTKIIIIILVLLIHLLLLIPFILKDFTFLPKSPLEQKVKELHKKVHKIKDDEPEEWATLKSRATQMSAPVILVDDSDVKEEDTHENDEEKTEEIESTIPPLPPDKPTPDEPKKSTEQDISQPTLIDIPEYKGTRLIEQKKEEKIEPHGNPRDEKKPAQQTQPKISTPAPKKVIPSKTPTIAKAMKRPVTQSRQKQPPKLSLAQLAQGFTDHMKQEGDYTIAMSGNDNAKATESQLKIGRFLQKIIGSIQNSWKFNIKRYPLSQPVIVSIHFTVVINKDGSLNKVGIDKSSGNQLIDNYIKLIVQDASSSFPSIPNYMSHDICSIRCTLDDIRLPEGPPGYTIRQ